MDVENYSSERSCAVASAQSCRLGDLRVIDEAIRGVPVERKKKTKQRANVKKIEISYTSTSS